MVSYKGRYATYYTTDGTTPTCSTGTVYSSPISVNSSESVNAISCYATSTPSDVASFAYTINISTSSGGSSVAVASGGGGGGGGYYTPIPTANTSTNSGGVVLGASTTNPVALAQLLQNLEQQLVTLEFKANSCSFVFSRNLLKGTMGSDVKNLQTVLNYTPLTQVAQTGAGSPNDESTYFGNATKNAVIAFQNIFANQILTPIGLTSGNGYVGSATRAFLNGLCGQ